MVKFISFCDLKRDALVACKLDTDDCVSSNEKIAEVIDISMRKMDSNDSSSPKRILNGASTDAGGSGAGNGLAQDLRAHERLAP